MKLLFSLRYENCYLDKGMKTITDYFRNIGLKRIVTVFVTNVILGFGISIFKFAGLGTIVCAFGLGPVTQFFDRTVSRPFIEGKKVQL